MFNILDKKAVESHLLILAVFSVIMTSFIIIVVSGVYGEEHKDCKLIDYEVISMCKRSDSAEFKIQNNAGKMLTFEINGKKYSENKISPGVEMPITVSLKESSNVELVPYFTLGNEIYLCTGKSQNIRSEVLMTC